MGKTYKDNRDNRFMQGNHGKYRDRKPKRKFMFEMVDFDSQKDDNGFLVYGEI